MGFQRVSSLQWKARGEPEGTSGNSVGLSQGIADLGAKNIIDIPKDTTFTQKFNDEGACEL